MVIQNESKCYCYCYRAGSIQHLFYEALSDAKTAERGEKISPFKIRIKLNPYIYITDK